MVIGPPVVGLREVAVLGAAMKMKPKESAAVAAISFLIISVSSPRIAA